ncbi:MAG: bifunctional adenosylcobinamide kinase/adenosylcobinamide-phosphate guanylyltransferase [Nitrospirae bacterium]|nr:bifunctional adenosylcobinamide kinase/adenosylcobinamide-phosphate guanylyltransferase [Nitrospirota bacterium]
MSELSKITFVIGGARSGKSSFALNRASELPGKKVYIATAQAFDEEMKERITKHKEERNSDWDTIEESMNLAEVLRTASSTHDVVLIDCLTLWLSNLLLADKDLEKEMQFFISSLITHHASRVFVVSNEVGMGIVPDNELARRFRDISGRLNQQMASVADEVYLVAAGIPVRIKKEDGYAGYYQKN